MGAEASSGDDNEEEENSQQLATPCAPRTTSAARRNEKRAADIERDELLNQSGKLKLFRVHNVYVKTVLYCFI